jgi:coatomer subunit beta
MGFGTKCSLLCNKFCHVQLIEFLSDKNEAAAADVLVFVREAVQRFSQLKPLIISKLMEVFPSIKALT